MRDIASPVEAWLQAGEPVALATVVATWGSAPRGVGAKLAVTTGDRMAGSVSGGCVEAAVVEAARETLATGLVQHLAFGVTDESAWSVGLACGGRIEVLVELLDPDEFRWLGERAKADVGAARAVVIGGPAEWVGRRWLFDESSGSPGEATIAPSEVQSAVAGALRTGQSTRIAMPVRTEMRGDGEIDAARIVKSADATNNPDSNDATNMDSPLGAVVDLIIDVIPPRLTLFIIGGVHIAVALIPMARTLGYRTVLVDPRSTFASLERFTDMDQLLQCWPDEAFRAVPLTATTAVAVLTHDPKIDDPALALALPGPAFYVGALGSRKTQAARRVRLRERGLSEAAIERLRGPIGLDLGGTSPEEIALAVMAEIVAVRNGASGI